MTTSYANLIQCQAEQGRIRALLEACEARLAAVEAERDAVRAEAVAVIENYSDPEEDETLAQVVGRIYENAEEGWARAGDLQAALSTAQAEAARAVETLRKIREEFATIASRKEEEVRNDFTSGESHGWGMAYLHVVGIGSAADSSALAWLAQREREAAAKALEKAALKGWATPFSLREDAAALRAGKVVDNA